MLRGIGLNDDPSWLRPATCPARDLREELESALCRAEIRQV